MKEGNYAQWLSHWDAESQKMLIKEDAEQKRPSGKWPEIWRNVLAGQRIVLKSKLETGQYVLLSYSLLGQIDNKETFHSLYVAKQQNGVWVGTQELSKDALRQNYFEGKERITSIVR